MQNISTGLIKSLVIAVGLVIPCLSLAQEVSFEGGWTGQLESDQVTLEVFLKLSQVDDSTMTCLMDIPSQSVKDFPASNVEIDSNRITITWDAAQARYTGTMESTNEIHGLWIQAAVTLPLVLNRAESDEFKRPQEPRGELPYTSVDVSFASADDPEVSLGGTLTYPADGKAKAAMVLVTGSGAQNRNEEMFGHRPFLVIADYLTRNGYAVLRYDDRGVGSSTGQFNGTTSVQFAGDAEGGITYLMNQELFKTKEYGLIGHSEGGTVGILLAAKGDVLDFAVLLASPGVANDELLVNQTAQMHIIRGSSPEDTRLDTSYARGVYNLMKNNPIDQPDTTALRALATAYHTDSELIRSRFANADIFYQSQLTMISDPWFYDFVNFNPDPYLRQIKCPILALNGSLDFQVTPELNLGGIEAGLKASKCKDFETREMPGLNHLFQPAGTGGMEEYGQIDITVDPTVLSTIQRWLDERT